MESVVFLVQGSEPEAYTVTFRKSGANITAICTCRGGGAGTQCKHRVSILYACTDGIVSPNVGDVARVCSWLAGTELQRALTRLEEAERAMEAAKAELSAARRAIAQALRD